METKAISSGKCLRTMLTKAGQQEEVVALPAALFSRSSSASLTATISAPSATSYTSSNPRRRTASLDLGQGSGAELPLDGRREQRRPPVCHPAGRR